MMGTGMEGLGDGGALWWTLFLDTILFCCSYRYLKDS